MVKTRIDLKKRIVEYIGEVGRPFNTGEVVEFARKEAPNLLCNGNRISKFIRGTKTAEFDKKRKVWYPLKTAAEAEG